MVNYPMKKTSRKLLVPLIILAFGIALVSNVGAVVDYSGQKTGPTSGQHFGGDNSQFDSGHNVNFEQEHNNDFNQYGGYDSNQWDRKGHESNNWDKGYNFKSGYHGYWNYLYKPYYWYYQFRPYSYQYNKWYWQYPSWFHNPYDHEKH